MFAGEHFNCIEERCAFDRCSVDCHCHWYVCAALCPVLALRTALHLFFVVCVVWLAESMQ